LAQLSASPSGFRRFRRWFRLRDSRNQTSRVERVLRIFSRQSVRQWRVDIAFGTDIIRSHPAKNARISNSKRICNQSSPNSTIRRWFCQHKGCGFSDLSQKWLSTRRVSVHRHNHLTISRPTVLHGKVRHCAADQIGVGDNKTSYGQRFRPQSEPNRKCRARSPTCPDSIQFGLSEIAARFSKMIPDTKL